MPDLKYKITFASDNSGIDAAAGAMRGLGKGSKEAAGGMDSLGDKSLYASQAMMGVQQVSQGNVTAVMGLARSVRALWAAFAAGSGPIGVLILALMAAYKGVTSLTDRYKESAKASMESADKFKAFSIVVNDLRDALKKAMETSPIEEHGKWIDKLGTSYDKLAASAQKYAEAKKSVIEANKSAATAKVDVVEAQALMGAVGDPNATARIKLQAEQSRKGIEQQAAAAMAKADRDNLEKQKAIAERGLKSIGLAEQDTSGLDQLAAERDKLRNLKASLAAEARKPIKAPDIAEIGRRAERGELGTGVGVLEAEQKRQQEEFNKQISDSQKKYVELSAKIIDTEKNIRALTDQEEANAAKLKEQKKTALENLDILNTQIENNKTLLTQLEAQKQADDARLAAQEKINAENAKELALKSQKASLEKSIAATQKSAADALSAAVKKEDGLTKQAAAAWTHAQDRSGAQTPAEQIAAARSRVARGARKAGDADLLANAGLIEGGQETVESVKEKTAAIRRARENQRRGIRDPRDADVFAAAKLQTAAAGARAAREQMEKQQATDISEMRKSLNSIDKQLGKNLQLS